MVLIEVLPSATLGAGLGSYGCLSLSFRVMTTYKRQSLPHSSSAVTSTKKFVSSTVNNESVPAFTQYRYINLLEGFEPLEKRVANIFEECYAELGNRVRIRACLGRLKANDVNSTPLCLPVSTETLLQPSTSYQFIDDLPPAAVDAVVVDTLAQARTCWDVRGSSAKTFLEFHYSDNSTIGLQSLPESLSTCSDIKQLTNNPRTSSETATSLLNNGTCSHYASTPLHQNAPEDNTLSTVSLEHVKVCHLGHIVLFRPASDFHIQISCIARTPVERDAVEKSGLSVLCCKKRTLSYWDFAPKSGNGPSWTLSISRLTEVDLSPLHVPLCPPIVSLRLSPHWPLQNVLKPDGSAVPLPLILLRLASEMLLQVRDLAGRLDFEATSEDVAPTQQAYFFPGLFGDIAAESRRHYNVKKIGAAHQSSIESLRRLNNEVKRTLIEKYVPQHAEVLDLACGHGQDVLKYADQKIAKLVGVDISSEEIKEAIRRLTRDNHQRRPALQCPWTFFEGNVLDPDTYQRLQEARFDVVSMQLAIHYCVPSEKTTDDLLRRISSHLKPGGIFIGSAGNCERLAQLFCDAVTASDNTESTKNEKGVTTASPFCLKDMYVIGNSTYKVTFSEKTFRPIWTCSTILEAIQEVHTRRRLLTSTAGSGAIENGEGDATVRLLAVVKRAFQTTWGLNYTFWLRGHIDANEYVIPWENFRRVARRHKLRLIECNGFDQFLAYEEMRNKRLASWIRDVLSRVPKNDDELEAFRFYTVFAFQKDETILPELEPVAPQHAASAGLEPLLSSLPKTQQMVSGGPQCSLAQIIEEPEKMVDITGDECREETFYSENHLFIPKTSTEPHGVCQLGLAGTAFHFPSTAPISTTSVQPPPSAFPTTFPTSIVLQEHFPTHREEPDDDDEVSSVASSSTSSSSSSVSSTSSSSSTSSLSSSCSELSPQKRSNLSQLATP